MWTKYFISRASILAVSEIKPKGISFSLLVYLETTEKWGKGKRKKQSLIWK